MRAHEGVNGRDAATNQAAGGGGAETRDTYDFDGDGVFETQFVTPAVAAALAGYEFSPDLHQPWVDEYIVGFRKQFAGQMSVDVASTTVDIPIDTVRLTSTASTPMPLVSRSSDSGALIHGAACCGS